VIFSIKLDRLATYNTTGSGYGAESPSNVSCRGRRRRCYRAFRLRKDYCLMVIKLLGDPLRWSISFPRLTYLFIIYFSISIYPFSLADSRSDIDGFSPPRISGASKIGDVHNSHIYREETALEECPLIIFIIS
jgi:hypothetical protein